jgi:hypothetical protein
MPNLYFDALVLAGEDALTNHFLTSLVIPALPIPNFPITNLNLRVTNFSIPEVTTNTYEWVKRGKKYTRPSGLIDNPTEFSFTYRIDKYFAIYNAITAWMEFIHNRSNGTMASDSGLAGIGGPSLFRAPIVVNGLDANGVITNMWSFFGCYPTSHDGIEFDEETGDPLSAAVTMHFVDMLWPGIIIP